MPPQDERPFSLKEKKKGVSVAFTLHDAGKNPQSVAKVRAICADYGLYLPNEVTALRAAEME